MADNSDWQYLDKAELDRAARQFTSRPQRPFLSWAGSKRRLLPEIVPHLPPRYKRYFEPFLGGGSLALLLQPNRARLSDMSTDLIRTWQQVAANPEALIRQLGDWRLEKDKYYELRAAQLEDPVLKAARFIFLNKGAFNGLYRVNLKGEFNVPWGAPKTHRIIDEQNIRAVAQTVSKPGVSIQVGDFARSIAASRKGDLVYADPPYVTTHNTNGFKHYNEKIFSWADQERLARIAENARQRGAHVLISNANHDAINALYPNFRSVPITRFSTISADPSKRVRVGEVLLVGNMETPLSTR